MPFRISPKSWMRRQLNDGGWTDAKPEQVLEAVGCAVGCVPPFGQLTPIPVFMDPDLVHQECVSFNTVIQTIGRGEMIP